MYCYITLPLDLHVLSLPLAFILSQDQTLLCIFFISLSSIRHSQLSSNKKKSTLSITFRFGTCYLYFVFSLFNDLCHTCTLPSASFWLPILSLMALSDHPCFKRDCKGRHFFLFCKLFSNFFCEFFLLPFPLFRFNLHYIRALNISIFFETFFEILFWVFSLVINCLPFGKIS